MKFMPTEAHHFHYSTDIGSLFLKVEKCQKWPRNEKEFFQSQIGWSLCSLCGVLFQIKQVNHYMQTTSEFNPKHKPNENQR